MRRTVSSGEEREGKVTWSSERADEWWPWSEGLCCRVLYFSVLADGPHSSSLSRDGLAGSQRKCCPPPFFFYTNTHTHTHTHTLSTIPSFPLPPLEWEICPHLRLPPPTSSCPWAAQETRGTRGKGFRGPDISWPGQRRSAGPQRQPDWLGSSLSLFYLAGHKRTWSSRGGLLK